MRLRLFHHHDGARIAFRQAGVGPPLVILHSAGLSHREFEPLVRELADRFRVILPDLPLHGDSENHPQHSYSPAWVTEVMAAFCHDVGGPSPVVAGHGVGAQILLRAIHTGQVRPSRLIVMPNALHATAGHPCPPERTLRTLARAAAIPGLCGVASQVAARAVRPHAAIALTARETPAAQDLIRHGLARLAGNTSLARAWARGAQRWAPGGDPELEAMYPGITIRTLLLWADEDPRHPVASARTVLDVLPDADLRVLPGTGFLIAYDDPVGVAREIIAFCR